MSERAAVTLLVHHAKEHDLMLTRDEVIWGFRYILGRDPESEDVVARYCTVVDRDTFRQALFESPEFAKIWRFRPAAERWVIAPVFGGTRLLWINLFDQYVARGCLIDDYEHYESAFVRANLKSNSTFLDIGANVGWFTVLASTIIETPGMIVAFEPREDCAKYLQRTIALNNISNVVTLIPEALADRAGEGFVAWPRQTTNPGHSFLASSLSDGMDGNPTSLRPLDDHGIINVDFIKMDVEGAEMRVLRGAIGTIAKSRPTVLTEIYPEQLASVSAATSADVFTFFADRSYRAFIVDPCRLGEEVKAYPERWHRELVNIVFIPEEKVISRSVVPPTRAEAS